MLTIASGLLPQVRRVTWVQMRGGRLPEPEANGLSYLKIPLNRFQDTGCDAIRASNG